MPRIHLASRGLSGRAPAGITLHEAMRRLGSVVDYACGGNALCGTCCVLVVEGEQALSPPGPGELEQLKDLGVSRPHRLSCQARILDHPGEIVIVDC